MVHRQTRYRLRGRLAALFLAALFFAGTGCSSFSHHANRRDSLQEDLKRFHMALMMKDTPLLLRQIPKEDRPDWAEAFPCFFEKFRVVDYTVQEIKTGPKVEDARVVVWVSRHAVDSLSTREMVWVEEWVYEEKRWFLDTASEKTREYLGDCLPARDAEPEEEGAP